MTNPLSLDAKEKICIINGVLFELEPRLQIQKEVSSDLKCENQEI
jgi:hypothetical protein